MFILNLSQAEHESETKLGNRTNYFLRYQDLGPSVQLGKFLRLFLIVLQICIKMSTLQAVSVLLESTLC